MNQQRNWLSALSHKAACMGLVIAMGFTAFLGGIADARLIFTTEGDGTLIDTDVDGDSNFSLYFGATLGEEIEFDVGNDRFNISNDILVTGEVGGTTANITSTSQFGDDITLNNAAEILNLRAENAATLAGTACDEATEEGRIYYDTTLDDLYFCSATGWVSSSGGGVNVAETYAPEFGSFAVLADGSSNVGTLTAEFDDTANHGYYRWDTRQTALHDYDLVVQFAIPEDFSSWQANAISFEFKTATTTVTDNQIDVAGEDTGGTALTLSSNADLVSAVADTWETNNMGITGGTFTAGQLMNVKFKVQADDTSNGATFLGPVLFQYVTS